MGRFLKDNPEPPSWSTQYGRSWLQMLPGMVGNIAGGALMKYIGHEIDEPEDIDKDLSRSKDRQSIEESKARSEYYKNALGRQPGQMASPSQQEQTERSRERDWQKRIATGREKMDVGGVGMHPEVQSGSTTITELLTRPRKRGGSTYEDRGEVAEQKQSLQNVLGSARLPQKQAGLQEKLGQFNKASEDIGPSKVPGSEISLEQQLQLKKPNKSLSQSIEGLRGFDNPEEVVDEAVRVFGTTPENIGKPQSAVAAQMKAPLIAEQQLQLHRNRMSEIGYQLSEMAKQKAMSAADKAFVDLRMTRIDNALNRKVYGSPAPDMAQVEQAEQELQVFIELKNQQAGIKK